MCVPAGVSILAFIFFLSNLASRKFPDAGIALAICIVFGLFAFVLGREDKERDAFVEFVYAKRQALNNDQVVSYWGKPFKRDSIVVEYSTCVSFILASMRFPSRYYIAGNHSAAGMILMYSVITLIFGWWSFPLGPVETAMSLATNMQGGKKQTVGELLDRIEIAIAEQVKKEGIQGNTPIPRIT